MNTTQTLKIIRKLADGVNPFTDKVFSPKSPYQHPDTVRALFTAIGALERLQEITGQYQNAGNPWTKLEQLQLVKAYDSGETIKEIAQKHQRTTGAIYSRLALIGKIIE